MAFYYKLEMENSAILRSNDVHSSIALKSRVLDNCWHLASYPTNLYAPLCVTGLEKSKLHFPDILTSGSTLDFFLSSISQEGKWKLCFLWQHGAGAQPRGYLASFTALELQTAEDRVSETSKTSCPSVFSLGFQVNYFQH